MESSSCCGCCSPRRVQVFALLIAAVTIIAVLIILFLYSYPSFARSKIIEAVVFRNGSVEMERFETTADLVNLRLVIYVYNVTNPYEVWKSSAKIRVEEVGPFVYHEYKTKEFLNNNQTSGLITYKLRRRFTFQPDESVGDPTEMQLTWINVPVVAAQPLLDKLNVFERMAAYLAFNTAMDRSGEGPFITDTVENFIFTGSKRDLFAQMEKWVGRFIKGPWPLKDNKFAVFYDKNDTWVPGRDHVFTMSAGFGTNQSVENLNHYIYMNDTPTLPFWHQEPPQCNQIGGTDGEFFPPFLNTTQTLEAYSIDICRKLSLKYRLTTYIDDIEVYKYSLDESSLGAPATYSENMCYCLDRLNTGDGTESMGPTCQWDGLIDLSTCAAPNIVASGTHFLHGDPSLSKRVRGVPKPNVTNDEPYVYVEPNTGLTIQVRVPLQMNVRLQKSGFTAFNFFQDEEPLIIPLFHLVEAAELVEDQAAILRSKLVMLDSWLVSMVLGGAIILILAIFAVATILCIRYGNRQPEVRPASPGPSETASLIPATSTGLRHSRSSSSSSKKRQSRGISKGRDPSDNSKGRDPSDNSSKGRHSRGNSEGRHSGRLSTTYRSI